jgi:hypothetical protein
VTVALVARGPDRARYPGPDPFALTLAVNHASAGVRADWWVFGDSETWESVTPLGAPRWFTNANAANRVRKRGGAVPADVLIWESLEVLTPPAGWHVFSATAALVLAKHLGATEVRAFGVVDEFAVPGEADRWATERRIWNACVEWLGVPVSRP